MLLPGHAPIDPLSRVNVASTSTARLLPRVSATVAIPSTEGSDMDKNRVEGTKHEVKGAVKEVAGKVTGNKTKEAAGNIEKNAGKVQKEVGKAADDARKGH